MGTGKQAMADRVIARFQVDAMSNLRSTTTGVEGAVVWVSAGEFAGSELQHGPRIKVVVGDGITAEKLGDAVSVTLTDPPRVLGHLPREVRERVVSFVERNRDVLLRHWDGEIDTREMLDLLQKV